MSTAGDMREATQLAQRLVEPGGVVLLSPWVDLALQSWSVLAATLARSTPSEGLAAITALVVGTPSPTSPETPPPSACAGTPEVN